MLWKYVYHALCWTEDKVAGLRAKVWQQIVSHSSVEDAIEWLK